jgi:hypothetical protein
MQTLKYELGVLGAALFGLGTFFALQGADAAVNEPAPVAQFTAADFVAFDRSFEMDGANCAVGFVQQRLCFGRSPYETGLAIGQTLPPEVPILAAEFRVIVETELKIESLRTIRFGQTLLLIDPQTRKVHDMLRLTASDLETARKSAAQTAS